jgi:hypothetical protein
VHPAGTRCNKATAARHLWRTAYRHTTVVMSWACSACTYVNDSHLAQCDICTQTRTVVQQQAAPPRVIFIAPTPRMSAADIAKQMEDDAALAQRLQEEDDRMQDLQQPEQAAAAQNGDAHMMDEDVEDTAAADSAAHVAAAAPSIAAPAASSAAAAPAQRAAQKPSVKRARKSAPLAVRRPRSDSESDHDEDDDDDAQQSEESDYAPDEEENDDPDRDRRRKSRGRPPAAKRRKSAPIPASTLSKLPSPSPSPSPSPPQPSNGKTENLAAAASTEHRPRPSTQPSKKVRSKEPAKPRRDAAAAASSAPAAAAASSSSNHAAASSRPALKREKSGRSDKQPQLSRAQSEQKGSHQKRSHSFDEDESDEKPYDWSPLWSLRGEPLSATGFHPTALSQLFSACVTQSEEIENGLARNVVRSSVRSDNELVNFLDLLCKIIQKHHERSALYTLPEHVVEGLWTALLAREVTLHGAQSAYPLLLHLSDLSPCSLLPLSSSFLQWSTEARRFSAWLRRRREMKESGRMEKLGEEVRRSVTPNSAAAAASSASSSASPYLLQAEQFDAQHRISTSMQVQKDAEVYWAKWCIKTQLMMRAMAMDEAARLDGGVDAIRPIPTPLKEEPHHDDEAEAAEVEAAILLTSDPLFLSLILHTPRKHRLSPSSPPRTEDLLPTIAEDGEDSEAADGSREKTNELEGLKSGKEKKKTAKKKVTSKQMKAAQAAAAAVAAEESKSDALELDGEEDDDALEPDELFHVFWQELLDYIGLARPSVANPMAHQQNQITISTFRSQKCLNIYQETVQHILAVLANLHRRKPAE